MTADLREKCHFGAFHIFLSQISKYAFFKGPVVNWWWFSSFLKAFQKVEKFEEFHDCGPARKILFLGISHFCIFLTQISKYAHFKGPVVNWWWFSSFLKAFQKVEKFEDFHDRGPATNCRFWAFHIFAYFSPKSANIHISRVLWSTGGGFHHFLKAFPESQKIWRFSWQRTCDKLSLLGISHFCIFLTQICKYTHFKGPVVNWWWFSSFFERLSRKSKNLKILMTADLREKCHFWAFHFFLSQISKYAYFKGPVVNWWWFSSFLKAFQKVEKFEEFHDRVPARKISFLDISHFCVFLTQISKYAHFKGPVVNWWWFSSFLKAFQKVEKFEDFHDCWPARKMSFLGISHFCIFLTQISKYAHFKGPVANWWWFSSFLKAFQKVEKFEDFHDPDMREKYHFWAFHIFAYFSPKSANMHISRVLWPTGGGFHHF